MQLVRTSCTIFTNLTYYATAKRKTLLIGVDCNVTGLFPAATTTTATGIKSKIQSNVN